MNEIKTALDNIKLDPMKEKKMHEQLFAVKSLNRNYRFSVATIAATLVLMIIVSTSTYAAYRNGFLDKVFGLNNKSQFSHLTEDISEINQYVSNPLEPVTLGDYQIQILGHLVNDDLQMGVIYYSIENVNPDSKNIFAIFNVNDAPNENHENYYFGFQNEYKEYEVLDKTITELVIPQNDPPKNYYDKESSTDGKQYIAIRYVSVQGPFTFLNLVHFQWDNEHEVIGQIQLPAAKSTPTIELINKNDRNANGKVLLSAIGMKLINFDFDNGNLKYSKEEAPKIRNNIQIVSKNKTVDLSDIMTSFVSSQEEPTGTTSISQEFRLLLKIDAIESVIIDGVEYSR